MYDVILPEERTIEIYSPDGVHALALRAGTSGAAAGWHRALHAAARRAARAALARARPRLRPLLGDVRFAGWLARRPPQDHVSVLSLGDRCCSELASPRSWCCG